MTLNECISIYQKVNFYYNFNISEDISYYWNPCGLLVLNNGAVVKCASKRDIELLNKNWQLDHDVQTGIKSFEIVKPYSDENGYLFISDEDMSLKTSSSLIKTKDGDSIRGKYLHRIVVFSFGDCKGRKYSANGIRSIIDHKDMNHKNNAVENLELVSQGINLFRAYYLCNSEGTKQRFEDYYNSLSSMDRRILELEMELDLKGEY